MEILRNLKRPVNLFEAYIPNGSNAHATGSAHGRLKKQNVFDVYMWQFEVHNTEGNVRGQTMTTTDTTTVIIKSAGLNWTEYTYQKYTIMLWCTLYQMKGNRLKTSNTGRAEFSIRVKLITLINFKKSDKDPTYWWKNEVRPEPISSPNKVRPQSISSANKVRPQSISSANKVRPQSISSVNKVRPQPISSPN